MRVGSGMRVPMDGEVVGSGRKVGVWNGVWSGVDMGSEKGVGMRSESRNEHCVVLSLYRMAGLLSCWQQKGGILIWSDC